MRPGICPLLSIWLFGASAFGATNTWLGGTSFDWFAPANWSENRVPTDTDVVIIPYDKTVHNIDSNAVFATLELYGGLRGDVHVRTVLNCWYNGSLNGSLAIASNGVLNIHGVVALQQMVTNYGRVNFIGRFDVRWNLYGKGWYNAPSGILEFGGGVLDGGGATLINDGTIRCGGVQLLNLDVEHYGTIEVLESALPATVRGGRFLSDGRIFAEFGAVLSVTDGTLALREHHTVVGEGIFGIWEPSGGMVTIEDWIYGRLDLVAGTLLGNIRIHSNAVLNVVRPPFLMDLHTGPGLDACSVTNYGTVNVSPDFGWRWGEVRFYNAPSGVIEIGGYFRIGEWNSRASLLNEGIIRTIRTSYGGMEFWGRFTNAGVLELRAPLPIWGFFAQSPAGSTVFYPDGTNLLSITATAHLAGRLAISLPPGSQPTAGTTFEIMTFRDRVGEFQTFSGLGIAPGLRFDVLEQYKPLPDGSPGASISLRVVAPQNRVSQPQFVGNALTFTFDGDADRSYDIESSTNLVNWDRLYTTNGQTGVIPFRDREPLVVPHRFYRLRAIP